MSMTHNKRNLKGMFFDRALNGLTTKPALQPIRKVLCHFVDWTGDRITWKELVIW